MTSSPHETSCRFWQRRGTDMMKPRFCSWLDRYFCFRPSILSYIMRPGHIPHSQGKPPMCAEHRGSRIDDLRMCGGVRCHRLQQSIGPKLELTSHVCLITSLTCELQGFAQGGWEHIYTLAYIHVILCVA